METVEVEVVVRSMEIWRYIALFLFYILTNVIAFLFGFKAGGANMYKYCARRWGIEEEEQEDNGDE